MGLVGLLASTDLYEEQSQQQRVISFMHLLSCWLLDLQYLWLIAFNAGFVFHVAHLIHFSYHMTKHKHFRVCQMINKYWPVFLMFKMLLMNRK